MLCMTDEDGSAGTHENDAVTSLTIRYDGLESREHLLSDERYRRAAAAGGVGVWNCDLETEEIYVDPVLKQMLGYEDHEIGNTLEDCGRLIHPDDAATIRARPSAYRRPNPHL